MEFLKRGAAIYAALSLVFPLMAESMKANGAAVPWNPGWQLVSSIRNLFIYSWVLLLVSALIYLAIVTLVNLQEAARCEAEKKKEAAQEEQRNTDRMARQAEEERQRLMRKELEHKELEEKRIAYAVAKRREEEEKRNRTTEDAIDLALKDFG